MKIERGYAEYSDKAIKRVMRSNKKSQLLLRQKNRRCSIVRKQLKPFKRVPIKQPVAVSEWQSETSDQRRHLPSICRNDRR